MPRTSSDNKMRYFAGDNNMINKPKGMLDCQLLFKATAIMINCLISNISNVGSVENHV